MPATANPMKVSRDGNVVPVMICVGAPDEAALAIGVATGVVVVVLALVVVVAEDVLAKPGGVEGRIVVDVGIVVDVVAVVSGVETGTTWSKLDTIGASFETTFTLLFSLRPTVLLLATAVTTIGGSAVPGASACPCRTA